MITLIVATIVSAPAANYFPLTPGAEWEYAIIGGPALSPKRLVYKAVEPVQVQGKTVSPLESFIDGNRDSITYYTTHEGFHAVAGTHEGTLLSQPIPFLPVDPKRGQKWVFAGHTVVLGGEANEQSTYTVNGFETIEVMGQKINAVKVTRQSEAQVDGMGLFKTKSIDWYGDGIGLLKSEKSVEVKDGAKVTYLLVRTAGLVR